MEGDESLCLFTLLLKTVACGSMWRIRGSTGPIDDRLCSLKAITCKIQDPLGYSGNDFMPMPTAHPHLCGPKGQGAK